LDNRLQALLESFFVELSKERKKALFVGNGCLAMFSSRIKLSYALGLIGEAERHDLDIIRHIRNDFAHDESSINFESSSINKRCNSLLLYNEMERNRPDIEHSGRSNRDKFQIVGVSLCLLLEHRTKAIVSSKRVVPDSIPIFSKRE
jgi:DNA-binding MltR family transcriptional regulator